LAKDGHRMETVANGADALAWLERSGSAVDLIITDHHMPVMNGLDLVQRVRQSSFAGKIIVFSSELNPLVHDHYRQLGVDLILPKPIFPVTLRRMLAELFAPTSHAAVSNPMTEDLVLA
jgi:CheY-like chemotaxis protein